MNLDPLAERPARPYATQAVRLEPLPFRVRIARGAQDLAQVVDIRSSAYGRHLPHVGDALRTAEHEDSRPDVLLLLAERKFDGKAIGTMRLESNLRGPLRVESEASLPAWLRGHRMVEITRLGVDPGGGAMVTAALAKAAFELCHASRIEHGVAVGRRSMAEMFRSLCLEAIAGPARMSYAPAVPFWIFSVSARHWLDLLRDKGHFFFDFMEQTEHPDIEIDYAVVAQAFGAAD